MENLVDGILPSVTLPVIPGQEQMQGPWRSAVYWFVLSSLLNQLSYTPRTTCQRMTPPMKIRKCLQADLNGDIFSIGGPCSRMALACSRKTSQDKGADLFINYSCFFSSIAVCSSSFLCAHKWHVFYLFALHIALPHCGPG